MSSGKPTLHHLNNSQSQQILWLLEELGIDYDLKLYQRQTSGASKARSPEELKKIHPLGKSPTLTTADGKVVIERSAIGLYLINSYDTAGRFKSEDVVRDDMLTNFAGASINPIMLMTMMFDLIADQSPFFIRPMFSGLSAMMKRMFLTAELDNLFAYLQTELGDQEYFQGSHLTRADFMIMWPVDFCQQRGYLKFSKYPQLKAWHERCVGSAGWKSALEKGNGYDMNISM